MFKILAMCAVMAFVAATSAYASPITYDITFSGGPILPTSGSFVYDGSLPLSSRFSDFSVVWDGISFDLTSAANAPFSQNCGPADAAQSFKLLSGGTVCPLVNGSPPVTGWGVTAAFGSAFFDFVSVTSPFAGEFVIRNVVGPTGLQDRANADGSFSISPRDTTAIPEPSSVVLVATGVFLATGLVSRGTLRFRGKKRPRT